MGSVVVELIERNLVGAVVHCPGGTVWELGRSQPEAEMGSSSTGIVAELVVGVDNPETCWVNVRIKQAVRHSGEDGKIILDDIVHLNSILQEES